MSWLEWFLIGLYPPCLLVVVHKQRLLLKEKKRSSHWRWLVVRACETIMAERGGGTELAKRTAKDFCRYNHPQIVIESFFGEEAKEP